MTRIVFRLAVLRWLYDTVVEHLALGLLLVGIVGVFGGYAVRGFYQTPNVWVFVMLAVAGSAYAIYRWKYLTDLKHSFETRVKSLLYRFARLGMPLGGAPTLSNWASLIVSKNFSSISFRRKDQLEIAKNIALSLKEGKKLFVIEGESGVGKTAAAVVAIDRLLCDRKFSKFVRKIYYIDLAVHGELIGEFLRKAESSFFDEATLIIDNFHRIAPHHIEAFSAFANPDRLQCEMLLVLSQPREYITLCPGHAIGPFRVAEENKTAFRLMPPETDAIQSVFRHSPHFENIALALDRMEIPTDSPIRWLAHVNLERLYQIILNDLDKVVEQILLMRLPTSDPVEHPRIVKVLATISALAIHSGVFTDTDLQSCLVALSKPRDPFRLEYRRLRSCFNRLRRQSLVLEAIGQRRVYVFHQTLAEHLKDRLANMSSFAGAFRVAGETVRRKSWVSKDPLLSWLFAVELGDEQDARRCFSEAMFTGAFGVMRRALLRNPSAPGRMALVYERAILAERTGAWTEARRGLAIASSDEEADPDARAWATIAAVEAEHAADSVPRLRRVAQDSTVADLPKLAARYWLVHLDSHQGRFDIDSLYQLLTCLERNQDDFEKANKFEFVQISRRVLFDTARFLFLIGKQTHREIHGLFHRPIARYLKINHPYYEAYRLKFYVAHSLHYQYLYQLMVLKTEPEIDEEIFEAVGLSKEADIKLESLAAAAQAAYRNAMERFSVFGDKTAEYIKPRLLEVRLATHCSNLDEEYIALSKYRKFIEETGIADLQPYPHVYYFKFHLLKAWRILQETSDPGVNLYHLDEFDLAVRKAGDALREAIMGFEETSNQYGLLMCHLFRATLLLMEAATRTEAQELLSNVKDRAEKLGYRRIIEAVELLGGTHIGAADLQNMVAYFPFVHQ